ncbi:MAG: hypothetical protein QOI56_610 [Actinomycetota bacterium]|jgi:hypothetical protein|nr:hypothetical protein [Actinomycetota bacterium]
MSATPGPGSNGPPNFADDYAAALGRAAMTAITLTADEVDALLDLARDVAHGTERRFAPLVSYLAGKYVVARTGDGATVRQAVDEALDVANRLLAATLEP